MSLKKTQHIGSKCKLCKVSLFSANRSVFLIMIHDIFKCDLVSSGELQREKRRKLPHPESSSSAGGWRERKQRGVAPTHTSVHTHNELDLIVMLTHFSFHLFLRWITSHPHDLWPPRYWWHNLKKDPILSCIVSIATGHTLFNINIKILYLKKQDVLPKVRCFMSVFYNSLHSLQYLLWC